MCCHGRTGEGAWAREAVAPKMTSKLFFLCQPIHIIQHHWMKVRDPFFPFLLANTLTLPFQKVSLKVTGNYRPKSLLVTASDDKDLLFLIMHA